MTQQTRQCVSPILQHPLKEGVMIWSSGSLLLSYDLGYSKQIIHCDAHKAPILSISLSVGPGGEVFWVTAGEDKRILIHRSLSIPTGKKLPVHTCLRVLARFCSVTCLARR
jgi:hypothetical protein